MFCPHCSVDNPDEAKFCRNCGKKMPKETADTTAQIETPKTTNAGDVFKWIGYIVVGLIVLAIFGGF